MFTLINSFWNICFCLLFFSCVITKGIEHDGLGNVHENSQLYPLIQSFLDQYTRPFTLLDIDADQGYYSLQVAKDYDAVCVMTEANDQLLEICKKHNELANIVLLKQHFNPSQLQHLGECEHFDVVLVFNLLHKFGEHWQAALEAMQGLGDFLIVKVSSKDVDLEKYINTLGGCSIGHISKSSEEIITLYSIKLSNNYLRRKTWLRSIMHKPGLYHIESSFDNKQLIKPVSWPHGVFKTTSWIHGLNLCTFKMCYGAYPTSEQLKNNLLSLANIDHTDWLMNNMIIQGATMALIDHDDPLSKRYFSKTLLQAHQEMLDLNEPEKIEHYFWHKLIKVPASTRHIIKFLSQLFPVSSVVFDIESLDTDLIDRYLGYGAKVISYNPKSDYTDDLRAKSRFESLIVVEPSQQKNEESGIILENLVGQYGKPSFCNFHLPIETALKFLKTLVQPIGCVACKFHLQDKTSLRECLHHLVLLGYVKFNFSVRNLPIFILDSNPYINIHKQWTYSVDTLMNEIDEFAKLDYDGTHLWGYVYARSV